MSKQFAWLRRNIARVDAPVRIPVVGIDWQNSTPTAPLNLTTSQVWLPSLLLDSDVMFFEFIEGTIAGLIREQEKVRSIFAVGGPAPFDVEPFREYFSEDRRGSREHESVIFAEVSDPEKAQVLVSRLHAGEKRSRSGGCHRFCGHLGPVTPEHGTAQGSWSASGCSCPGPRSGFE
jgi:hypothetical protein